MKSKAHLYISGRVQGVFYRAFAKEVANSSGLKGWVKNLPNGDVEAIFEGDKKVIEDAINTCKKGPVSSHVTNIDVIWEENLEGFTDFKILY